MQEIFEKIKERLEEQEEYETEGRNYNAATAYEKAIEIVNQVAEEYKEPTLTVEQLLRPNPNLKEFLKDAEEYNQSLANDGWIPVSERLPEEKGWYLITDKREDVAISFFFIDDHSFRRGYNPPAVAWRPLPPAYQPKGE